METHLMHNVCVCVCVCMVVRGYEVEKESGSIVFSSFACETQRPCSEIRADIVYVCSTRACVRECDSQTPALVPIYWHRRSSPD